MNWFLYKLANWQLRCIYYGKKRGEQNKKINSNLSRTKALVEPLVLIYSLFIYGHYVNEVNEKLQHYTSLKLAQIIFGLPKKKQKKKKTANCGEKQGLFAVVGMKTVKTIHIVYWKQKCNCYQVWSKSKKKKKKKERIAYFINLFQ